MNNEVFDIIILLVKSYDEASDREHPYIKSCHNNREYVIHNGNYILNQALRQINIPDDHYLLSKGANDLWNKLKPDGKYGKNIKDYWYREKLTVHSNEPVEIKEYSGASKTPILKKVKDGDTFIFKNVFHLEHIYPIDMIIEDLKELNKFGNLNYDSLAKVLDKIYICRITKEEDRNISSIFKSSRPHDLDKILKEVYTNIVIAK